MAVLTPADARRGRGLPVLLVTPSRRRTDAAMVAVPPSTTERRSRRAGHHYALPGSTTSPTKGTADSPLRVGLIGLGSMGRHHARVIRATEGHVGSWPCATRRRPLRRGRRLSARCPPHRRRARRRHGGRPTVYHEDVALALAEAGVHTMVEAHRPRRRPPRGRRLRRAGPGGCRRLRGALPPLPCGPARNASMPVSSVSLGPHPPPGPSRRISDVGVVGPGHRDISDRLFSRRPPPWPRGSRTAQPPDRGHDGGHRPGAASSSTTRSTGSPPSRSASRSSPAREPSWRDLTFHANGTVAPPGTQVAAFRGRQRGRRHPLIRSQAQAAGPGAGELPRRRARR